MALSDPIPTLRRLVAEQRVLAHDTRFPRLAPLHADLGHAYAQELRAAINERDARSHNPATPRRRRHQPQPRG